MIIKEIILFYLLILIIKDNLDNFNIKLDFIKLKGILNNLRDFVVINIFISLVI